MKVMKELNFTKKENIIFLIKKWSISEKNICQNTEDNQQKRDIHFQDLYEGYLESSQGDFGSNQDLSSFSLWTVAFRDEHNVLLSD